MISLYKLIKKATKEITMETLHLITFSLLIVTSILIILLTSKEEIKQSKMIKTSTNKNNFWTKNKHKTLEGRRELITSILLVSFIIEILFLHYIA